VRLLAALGPGGRAVPDRPAAADLDGARVVVHLSAPRDPDLPAARRRADTVDGTAALLEAARKAGARRVVLLTSADVLRAAPGQVPVPERGPLRAVDDGSLVADWLEVERLADHAGRTGLDVVVLRPAALVGLGPQDDGAVLRSLAAPRLLAVRGVEPLWQLCHADDLVSALTLAVRTSLSGPCAVACEGWLPQSRVEQVAGRRRLELPAAVALSTAERLHRLGVSTGVPSELDGLLAPVVVDPAGLRSAGWSPSWTNEAALAAHLEDVPPAGAGYDRAGAYAAGAAGATAALVGTAALVRRASRRRRR
jgi:nucleoside-diphosphate-sugar epimerase